MPDPKRKSLSSSLRTPKPKKALGLRVPPPIRMPHDELIPQKGQAAPITNTTNQPGASTLPSHTSHASHTSMTSVASAASDSGERFASLRSEHSIAPTRDFTRVANSISREAVPAGLFRGKSKQLYDCLYTLSRGAVTPSMTLRISRPKLMAAAGIGSRVTLDANITHLCQVGLITVRTIAGEHDGNEYTVYLPQEITALSDTSAPSQTSTTSATSSTQKLDRLVGLETGMTRHSLKPELSARYRAPNTFSNTDDDDTHTLDEFAGLLRDGVRQVLGGNLPTTEQERQRWKECACVLVDELKEAAGKAGSISSVPAFFATHLKRRFARRKKTDNKSDEDTKPRRLLKQSNAIDNSPPIPRSEFTLEDCRHYAESLQKSGQGITNPGGYATTIYRTGEADALIRAFLEQPVKVEAFDFTNCPDCRGTGFWYPRGIESGVVKCRHDRIRSEEKEPPTQS